MKKPILGILSLHLILLLSFSPGQSQTIPDKWLILSPVPVSQTSPTPTGDEQQEAFKTDHLDPKSLSKVKAGNTATMDGKTYTWKEVKAQNGVVDLNALHDTLDFVSAYGWVEFRSDENKKTLLGVGSDDGVKVWVNGELVHDNWAPRGLTQDNDLVPVSLKKGKNQLLIKVQDIRQGWGFSCRFLPPEVLPKKLTEAAASGHVDQVEMLLEHGADINAKNDKGLTSIQVAKMHGRTDMAKLLEEKGADANIPMPSAERIADAYFESLIAENQPGAAVLVARDGQILYKKGFGYADVKEKKAITAETIFRIGSITKQFTGAAILKLAEENKLSLDDKLAKYIPDYPRGDEVTIHHLLTHTSGIKSYTDNLRPDSKDVLSPIASVEDHIEGFKHLPYNFDPGTSWSYSNSGYFLLGYIVEKVAGSSYGDYLQKAFFQPLGMHHTGIHYGGIQLANEAKGHGFENGKVELAPDWEMSWAGAAGALYSTVDDLFKWNEALFGGNVLKKESLEKAFTPVTLNDGREANPKYGYGWMMTEYRGWGDLGHGGGLPGFITFLTRFPEENVTVAILTNASPPDKLNPQEAAYQLAEIFFWEDMALAPVFETAENVNLSLYPDYVGRYDYGGAVLTVSTEKGKLFAQLSGQPKFEIFPRNDDTFFWKVVDAQVQFVRNDEGHVSHAIHTQGGRQFEAPKLAEEIVVEVEPSILETYVGAYDMNGNTLTISMENAQLSAQLAGQPKLGLFPKSDHEFYAREVNAYLIFMKNEDGIVEKIVLEQGGMKRHLPKKE